MRKFALAIAGRLGIRRSQAAAPPLDDQPLGRMVLLGAGLGLLLGLPLALVLYHPWALFPWSALVVVFFYLGRDLEPLPSDLGLPEQSQTPRRWEPEPLVDLADIPAGRFRMGSPWYERGRYANEGPRHRVEVSSFRMMRTLVTRRLYRQHMDEVPGERGESGKDGDLPANYVSWYDAVRFCNALSAAEGLEPCYRIQGKDSVEPIPGARGYRLPTEAEWEYACRAGIRARFSFGSGSLLYFFDSHPKLGEHAWYSKNAGHKPHPVAEKKPNRWGPYDMHGNVWEWVSDWYGPYSEEAQTDPTGPPVGEYRVLRGGSFLNPPEYLRSALRGRRQPERRYDFNGFRCARAPSPSN